MKKMIVLLAFAMFVGVLVAPMSVSAENYVAISEMNFPDTKFREIIAQEFDTDDDTQLSGAEIMAVTTMDVSNAGIHDLTGIKYFTSLKELYCQANHIVNLDVSNMATLEMLNCAGNWSVELDEEGNPIEKLSVLNTSGCTSLTGLYCGLNGLTTLDVSNLTKLEGLYCQNNQLTEVNVKNNKELRYLTCGGNNLTSIDVSGMDKLIELHCTKLPNLTSLNVSGCVSLQSLQCRETAITTLDLKDCIQLTQLSVSYNPYLKEIDVSHIKDLCSFTCHGNNLTKLVLNDRMKQAMEKGVKVYDSKENRDVYTLNLVEDNVPWYYFLSVNAGQFQEKAPQTGDINSILWWTALAFLSCGYLFCAYVLEKKRKK